MGAGDSPSSGRNGVGSDEADDVLPLRPPGPDRPDEPENPYWRAVTDAENPDEPTPVAPSSPHQPVPFAQPAAAGESDDEDDYGTYDLAPEPEEPPPPPSERRPKEAKTVLSDRPCRICGYNLHGLPTTGLCPECGTPIAASKPSNLLRDANPKWVEKLVVGCWLLFSGIMVTFMLGTALGCAGGSAVLSGAIEFIGAGLMLAGAWLMTEPDPSGRGEDQYGTSRLVIRIGIAAGLVRAVVNAAVVLKLGPERIVWLLVAANLLASVVAIVGQLAMLRYQQKLATRIPDSNLSDRAEFLFWAYGLSLGLLVLFATLGTLTAVTGSSAAGGGILFFGCLAVLVVIAMVVFGVMYLFHLANLATTISAQRHAGDHQTAVVAQLRRPAPW